MLSKRKRYKNQTMRRARTAQSVGARNLPVTPANLVPTTVTHVGSTLVVVLPEPVIVSSVLAGWTNNGQHVIGMAVNTPTQVTLTFSGVTAAGATVVPFMDPSIRTMSGGFVQSGSYTAA